MQLEIIKHGDILFRDILLAVRIKAIAWPFPFESQIKWIVDNIKDDDEHVFLKEDKDVRAYLNLVRIHVLVNGKDYLAFGMGNVCAIEKGRGYGRELLLQVGSYITEKQYVGLLFCKSSLVQFYSQYGWEEIRRELCVIPSLSDGVHIMAFNIPEDIKKLVYHGALF